MSPGAYGADPPAGDWNDVRSLFAVGRFAAARELTTTLAATDGTNLQSLYWRYRLAESPAAAAGLRRELLDAPDLGDDARALLLTDAAWQAFGAGDYETTIALLEEIPLRNDETAASATLLGGLACRAQGDISGSRDALAAVPPGDPDYDWARYRLARLALTDGDPALARRYLEMAGRTEDTPCRAEILLLDWMLASKTDAQKATRLRRELEHRFPHSLPAALVVEQEQRQEELQRSLDTPSMPAPAVDGSEEQIPEAAPAPGRYTLQFAAFADRARALKFLDDWRERLPGLRICEMADERGLALYKLRAGSYAGMSQAREQASDLRARYDLAPLPVKAADSP